jgi:hypothetical protein
VSNQSEESLLEHLDGVGIGICLLIAGLVMTIGDLGPGAMVGFPLILLGMVLPVGMTYNARTESQRQDARRRPERDSNATYSIQTRKKRKP